MTRNKIMQDWSLKSIEEELAGARKHFPENRNSLDVLDKAVAELKRSLEQHKQFSGAIRGPGLKYAGMALQVSQNCIRVVVMGLRILEEGDPDYPYREQYRSVAHDAAQASLKESADLLAKIDGK